MKIYVEMRIDEERKEILIDNEEGLKNRMMEGKNVNEVELDEGKEENGKERGNESIES